MVWKQQIHLARTILALLLKTHGECLMMNLSTLITEVNHILNFWPLTAEFLNDPTSLQPWSPMKILTIKSQTLSAPPGELSKPDEYFRRHWQCIQHIANEFWTCCKKKYLQSLQKSQKWESMKKNFKVDNTVIYNQSNVLSKLILSTSFCYKGKAKKNTSNTSNMW